MTWQLAQLNIARLSYPLDHPAVTDFAAGLDIVNAVAEQRDGFVWRLRDDAGNATGIRMYDDPMIIVNLSVWESLDALLAFVHAEPHVSFLKRRREWFERYAQAYAALWWVPAGHRPGVQEAEQRLSHLRDNGPSPFAFSVQKAFSAPDGQHA